MTRLTSYRKIRKGKFTIASHLTPQQKAQTANLIGEKCLINCYLDDTKTKLLLETDAQVSIISKDFINKNLKTHQILNVTDILDNADSLKVALTVGRHVRN